MENHMGITHAYQDLDGVAYIGACLAEKLNYKFVKQDMSGEETEVFTNAADAKDWYERAVGFDEIVPEEWERVTVINLLPEKDAIKFTKDELETWIRTAKDLTGNNNLIFKGFLTCSGRKNKDVDHLEDRYQFNRYADKETWTAKPKPTHLTACRNYLINTYDWIKMSPDKIEADALVIYFAEKKGKKAVMMLKDKDLKQAMGTFYIDMNNGVKDRAIVETTEIGEISERIMSRGVKDYEGSGFKLICAQTMVGDTSDGYKGVKGYGPTAAVKMFKDLKTVDECCEVMVEFYNNKYKGDHKYVDWTGQEQIKTSTELLIQHCQLAYHERGAKDISNPLERYISDLDPIYRHAGNSHG